MEITFILSSGSFLTCQLETVIFCTKQAGIYKSHLKFGEALKPVTSTGGGLKDDKCHVVMLSSTL